jgi:hypothetical protein
MSYSLFVDDDDDDDRGDLDELLMKRMRSFCLGIWNVYNETLFAIIFWLRDVFQEAVPDIFTSVFDLRVFLMYWNSVNA